MFRHQRLISLHCERNERKVNDIKKMIYMSKVSQKEKILSGKVGLKKFSLPGVLSTIVTTGVSSFLRRTITGPRRDASEISETLFTTEHGFFASSSRKIFSSSSNLAISERNERKVNDIKK